MTFPITVVCIKRCNCSLYNLVVDTINSTLAHGPETRLPKEFYDKKGREIIEKIGVEEWFAGYKESTEYRKLGIGGLLGDVVSRMVGSAEQSTADGEYEIARNLEEKHVKEGKGATPIRFGLSGCHDTTLAAVLASLGAFNDDKWPPYTSHIAIEMFRKDNQAPPAAVAQRETAIPSTETSTEKKSVGWFAGLFSSGSSTRTQPGVPPPGIGRKRSEELAAHEKAKLGTYYVRLRYNDKPVSVPGCGQPGKHLEGDPSFCTLVSLLLSFGTYMPDSTPLWLMRRGSRVVYAIANLPGNRKHSRLS
jgi:acid phosphatase